MKIKLDCANAYHGTGMRVYCRVTNGLCGNQFFKSCKGWWTLTEAAKKCPIRGKSIPT